MPPNHSVTFLATSALTVIVALTLVSCGSNATSDNNPEDNTAATVSETDIIPIGDDPDIRAKTRPNSSFTYEQFINAGWKQHQIYEVDTLPDVVAARYGFFQRRDIEIRQYPDHATALTSGTTSAEDALERQVHDGSGFASRRIYGAYLVAGNLVMLCEVQVSDCTALIQATEAQR